MQPGSYAGFTSARRSLFCRTDRRTEVTAVEGLRQLGGTDWLLSGVSERHSRSEQNKEDYEQARDFHLVSPSRSCGYGSVYNVVWHVWMPHFSVVVQFEQKQESSSRIPVSERAFLPARE
jgi:hypothetical protein